MVVMLGEIISLWWVHINWVIKRNDSKLKSPFIIISNFPPIIKKIED